MSIEIWQFPRAATSVQIVRTLEGLGYEKGTNLFWPGPKGTINLFWEEPRDYKSTSGVDASVFPLDELGKEAWHTANDWALRTRTSVWASTFDKQHQNSTVREIRKLYGGGFYNDHFGKSRYNIIERRPSSPQSRGLYAVMARIEGELDSLEHAIPDEIMQEIGTPNGPITASNDETGIFAYTKQYDPMRIVYNALVPFLVAALEHFFRESFEILLKYDSLAQAILENQNRKLSYAEGAEVARGKLALERIASGWYSFQNLDSIQKAFKEVLGIDVWKVIRRRRKVRDRLPVLSDALSNLIGARHGVVHHFSLDRAMSKDDILHLIELVRVIIEMVGGEFERKLGVEIGPG